MSRWTMKTQLLGTLVAITLLFAAFAWNSLRTTNALNQHIVTIANADAVAMEAAARLQFLAMRLSSSADMIVVAAYDKDRAAVDTEWAAIGEAYSDLGRTAESLGMTTQVAANRDRARAVVDAMRQWHGVVETVVDHARAYRTSDASAAMEESERFSDDQATRLAADIFKAESENLAAARMSAADTTAASWRLQIGLIALVAVVLLGVGGMQRRTYISLRDVAVELRDGAGEVAMASGQMASFAQTLATGSTEQAAALQQTSASMEEMASVTRQNATRCLDAAARMAGTERLVTEAGQALGDLVTSMGEIRDSSAKVSKIIKTIDEIAFQTNILALNAAVEAARAGDAGMGFAVVADEVRNLAQRSSVAARDTAELIAESSASAARGGARVAAVETSMAAIQQSSSEVKSLVDQVSEASSAQALGLEEVRRAVMQIERVTQNTAATSEGSAAASEELSAQAEQTLSTLGTLERMVGVDAAASFGDAASHARTPATVAASRPADARTFKSAA